MGSRVLRVVASVRGWRLRGLILHCLRAPTQPLRASTTSSPGRLSDRAPAGRARPGNPGTRGGLPAITPCPKEPLSRAFPHLLRKEPPGPRAPGVRDHARALHEAAPLAAGGGPGRVGCGRPAHGPAPRRPGARLCPAGWHRARRHRPATSQRPTRTSPSTTTSTSSRHRQGRARGAACLFKTRPWTLRVEGEVAKPTTFDLDTLLAGAHGRAHLPPALRGGLEHGGAVDRLLAVRAAAPGRPTAKGQSSSSSPPWPTAQMPGIQSGVLDWSYEEGLRIDEAMHPLALLTFGLYGEVLPAERRASAPDGALEVRLQVGQVHRASRLLRAHAAHQLGCRPFPGVRFCQREPEVDHPAGTRRRAAHRRGRAVLRAASHLMFQRLRLSRWGSSTSAWTFARPSEPWRDLSWPFGSKPVHWQPA